MRRGDGLAGEWPKRRRAVKMIIRDLISDVRCAERDNMPEYAAKCQRELAVVWPLRNTGKYELDHNGWPVKLTTIKCRRPSLRQRPGMNMRCLNCLSWLIHITDGHDHPVRWVVCRHCEAEQAIEPGITSENDFWCCLSSTDHIPF